MNRTPPDAREQQILCGHEDAFARWWDDTGSEAAIRSALASGASKDMAKEVAQEVYCAVAKQVQARKIRDNVRGYVCRTASRKAKEMLRDQNKESQVIGKIKHTTHGSHESTDPWTSKQEATMHDILDLQDCFIADLKQNPGQLTTWHSANEEGFFLWFLYHISDLSHKEIGALMGDTADSTISDRILRFTKSHLHEVMAQWGQSEVLRTLHQAAAGHTWLGDDPTHVSEVIGTYLRSEGGKKLLLRLRGQQNPQSSPSAGATAAKKADNKMQKFRQTAGSILWLARYGEAQLSWEHLSSRTKLPVNTLQDMVERAYPVILLEYLSHIRKQPGE